MNRHSPRLSRLLLALMMLVLPLVSASMALGQSTRPARPATRPSGQPDLKNPIEPELSQEQMRRIVQLSKRFSDAVKAKKYDEAEKALDESLKIYPDNASSVYNMACTKALMNKSDEALDWLEKSVDKGFVDFLHIENDPDLTSLRELPRYKALLSRREQAQRQAADKVLLALKNRFGDKYLYEVDPEHKLIFATKTDPTTLKALKKSLTDQANGLWSYLFENKPADYISVVLPSDEDFRKIVRTPGVGGFYNPEARILIVEYLGYIARHEFTHALTFADLERLTAGLPEDPNYPIWLLEGLASLYENATLEGGKLVPHDNQRLLLLQAIAGKLPAGMDPKRIRGRLGKLVPVDKLVAMSQPQFLRQADITYGESSSLMLYLYDHGILRKFYDAYKANFRKDRTGRQALETATGKKIEEIDKDWQKWMVSRTPPALTTGTGGSYLGASFNQVPDGLMVDEVVDDAPAGKAGLKVKDMVVGIDENEVRDRQALILTLKQYEPGETVKLKVRRGEKYLEIPVQLAARPAALEPPPVQLKTRPETQPATRPGR